MRLVLALLLLSTVAAQAGPLDYWRCRLYPSRCVVPVEESTQPAQRLQSVPSPAPVAVAPEPHQPVVLPALVPLVRKKRVKSRFVMPARKRVSVVLPSWCARVPSWASLALVEATAEARLGRAVTSEERSQAVACIASKRKG